MAPDFDLGRQYERREVCALLYALLTVEDEATLRQLLNTWLVEASATIPVALMIDETYYVLAT